jgi:hypothetical protein
MGPRLRVADRLLAGESHMARDGPRELPGDVADGFSPSPVAPVGFSRAERRIRPCAAR